MTREQAQELLANVNGKIEMKRLDAVNLLLREIDELKMMEEDAQQYALRCRNELEAQLKAKNEEIAKYQMVIDKQSKRAEALKQLSLDKDNEIATAKMRHKLEHDRYLITEAIIKEKDEEIEMLQCRLYHAEGYIKDIHEPKDTK